MSDLRRFVDLPGSLADGGGNINDATRCDQEFTAKVTSLEYLNSDNIAVTYLSVVLREYDIATATPLPGKGRFVTQYYNPALNELRQVPWQKDVGVSATAEGRLCPAMRRLPQMGSLTTETVAMFVNMGRFAVRFLVGLPGMIYIWGQGRRCAEVTKGHSLLETCGAEIFSLDETFDSLERATSHFWGILHVMSARIRDVDDSAGVSDTIASVVSGAAMVAESTIVPIPGAGILASSMKLPTTELGTAMLSMQSIPKWSSVTATPLAMSR